MSNVGMWIETRYQKNKKNTRKTTIEIGMAF